MLIKDEIINKYNLLIEENKEKINTKYRTINGYKSVSKLISEMKNTDFLDSWKSRIGEQNALRIIEESAARGSAMHNLIESYFNDEYIDYDSVGYPYFQKLEKYIGCIEPVLIESTLFNHKLKITGRCDCIGLYKGKLSIIDFKTSRKPKKLGWMKGYTIQVTLYALMFYDMFGIHLEQSVLLNAPDDEDEMLKNPGQEFVFPTNDYLTETLEFLQRYRNGERKCLNL